MTDSGVGEPGLGRRAATGVAFVAASSWINRGMTTAVFVVAAAVLGPRQLGLLAVATLAGNVLLVLNDIGVGDAVVYTPDRVQEAAETALLVTLVVGAVMAGLGFAVAPGVARFYRVPDAANLLRAYSVMVFFDAAGTVPKALMTRELAFGRRLIPESGPALIGGPLSIVLFAAGVGVWSQAIGDGLRVVLGLALALVMAPMRARPRWHSDVARALWVFARNSLASSLLDFGLQNVDYALVPRLLTTAAFGYYVFAYKLAILPFVILAYPVAGVMFPLLARLGNDHERQLRVFRRAVFAGCSATFLLGGGLVALAPCAQVLGTKWAPAVGVTRALGVYICLRTAAHLLTPLLQAKGRPGMIALLRLAWVLVLGGLILGFAHRGVTAVGLAQVGAAGALLVAHAVVGRQVAGIDLGGFISDVGRPALCAVAAGVPTYALERAGGFWGRVHSPLTLVVLGVVYVAGYALAGLVLLRGLPSEVRSLRRSQ